MSASNNANKGKSVPPINDLMWWTDAALAENSSNDEKWEEEQKKVEEEWKHTEEAKKVEEARKVAEVKKAEEVWKAAEVKKTTASVRGTLTVGRGAKCEGCKSTGADCTMKMPSGSKATTCNHCRRQKMGCVCPGVEKKERWRKREEPTLPQGSSKRKQMWVQSPEVEDDEEEEDEEDALQLIARAINGLMQEVKEMWREYWEQGKWVVAAIDDLQHMLDPEYMMGPEEESHPEVPEEEVTEASAELGELRKEAEEAVEEPEEEESEEEEGSDDEEETKNKNNYTLCTVGISLRCKRAICSPASWLSIEPLVM
ncbi:hypothetical protein HYDPIDRAFT_32826 [Hydnomerulius pinastri MD-312]|uniref:Zn(2)-C6 fungal-type domain-containing protein n=1 Tax=Hydnomerulius pinastri MD-312 TaxID=994086 RepID=A0A0C9W9C2_9AGAM|nr:hypothetical protein HYDPIDRAFT_32826 [Hydnomerulius pinastri MD-312]